MNFFTVYPAEFVKYGDRRSISNISKVLARVVLDGIRGGEIDTSGGAQLIFNSAPFSFPKHMAKYLLCTFAQTMMMTKHRLRMKHL